MRETIELDLDYGTIMSRRVPGWLSKLFDQWGENNIRYAKLMDGDDVSWFYNERACVGLLAAAAWQTGYIAVEEYSALKGLEDKQRNGRADLWIYNPKSITLAIEAKFRWAWKVLKPQKLIQKLDEAVRDASCYQGGDKRIGAVFIVPFFPADWETSQVNEAIEKMLRVVSETNPDAASWCFPKNCRGFRFGEGELERIFPGIIVVMNVAPKAEAVTSDGTISR